MAILNFFKKKKKPEKKIEVPKKKVEEKIEEKKEVPIQPPKERKREIKVAPLVLKSTHVTEKATDLTNENQYVFKVFPGTGKQEIKKAVEETYGVDVLKVRTIKVPKKRRRLGRTLGWRKGYKKAIVTLKEGQKIEILPR